MMISIHLFRDRRICVCINGAQGACFWLCIAMTTGCGVHIVKPGAWVATRFHPSWLAQVFLRARKSPAAGWRVYAASARLEWGGDKNEKVGGA